MKTEVQTLRDKPNVSVGKYYRIIDGPRKGAVLFVASVSMYVPVINENNITTLNSFVRDWSISGYSFDHDLGYVRAVDLKGDQIEFVDTTPLSSDEVEEAKQTFHKTFNRMFPD
ncbi:MAG TPA: hypothetical protein PKH95_03985 [Candidatus Magasanikbacteria bacterium]|nr:hypothetical protein [Candidatus Magasanikbacteria bacterium]